MGFSLGKALGTIATGGLNLLVGGGGGSKVGSLLNDVTGATSAGKTNQKYAKELAAINQQYALESMKKQFEYERSAALNAHQWEMSDYAKAGLNPILSAGGSGASADVGLNAGSASPGSMQAGGAMAADLVNGITSAGKASAEYGLMKAQTAKTIEENKWISPEKKAQIANKEADTILKGEQSRTEQSKQELMFFEGMNAEQEAIGKRIANFIDQKDLDMLERLGVTRRELVDLGKTGMSELIGLLKAGKFAKVAEKVQERKRKK